MGEISSTGWPSYLPILLGIKTPLPVMVLLITALVLALSPPRRPCPDRRVVHRGPRGVLLMLCLRA
jgi:hypothetical protein